MKTIRLVLFFFTILVAHPFLYAQQTIYYDDIQDEILTGKELFQQKKYQAAIRQFEKIQENTDENSEIHSEAAYFKSVSALKAGQNTGGKMVEQFIGDHPESPYINEAWFNLGEYQFEKKQYTVALRSFQNIEKDKLSEEEKVRYHYQLGYCHLMNENPDLAAAEFSIIMDGNHMYSKPASYYWAHIMYEKENYESALKGFSRLNGDPVYSRFIPVYVSHIYYKQQRYDEVITYTVPLISEVEEEHRTELSRIAGDSYFHMKDFRSAIPFLETYYETPGPKTREDSYLLGYCYHHEGQYDQAAPLLEKASRGDDEMAQNAYYHLADCYVKLNEKEKARVAYEAAAEMEYNDKIREDALFSFAKLTYELSYSPFNETIKAFDRYISEYPASDRNTEAYQYLTEVFMVTRNYSDAINSIEKIKGKTPAIMRAYQRVTFYRGLELFNNLSYHQAIDYFNLSLENSSHNREIAARATFWKAEALYRTGDYSGSVSAYRQFLQTAGAISTEEYKEADYNLAYAYFKLEDYESAASYFRRYINANQGKRNTKLADAFNRTGDYFFMKTDYTLAVQNYQQAYDLNLYEADYALYQLAFCQGLQRNNQGKINNLNRLLSGFPESDYRDDALYELGRALERQGQNLEALRQYEQIVDEYAEGSYYRKALLQMGLIQFNNGDFNKALTLYKEVTGNYPGTPEAQAALLGIKNCYVEMNNVEGYFDYANRLGTGSTVTATEQDSLTYIAAERAFMAGSPEAVSQLQKYVSQFPQGSFIINARFYLAEALYKEGKYSASNEHYSYVAMQPANIFSEQALSRASELTFNAGQYENALALFDKLGKLADNKWNILKAYTGQMRCNLNLKNYPQAVSAAEKVKQSDIVNEALIREANYTIGKSKYMTGDQGAALSAFREISNDTKLEQGAEAKFRVAEILYNQKNIAQSEKEIMDFISKGTPYSFWLGKAFLLLADIYHDKGDEFQAKHTLKSIVENYGNDTDGIKDEAARKLAAIEAGEQKDQKNATDNSLQLKLNDNQ